MPRYNKAPRPRQIFLGSVSYDATPEEVAAALRLLGIGVARVRLSTEKETGTPRGFGFLDLDATEQRSEEDVIRVINQAYIQLHKRVLRANLARERGQAPEGGRGQARNEFKRGRHEFEGE